MLLHWFSISRIFPAVLWRRRALIDLVGTFLPSLSTLSGIIDLCPSPRLCGGVAVAEKGVCCAEIMSAFSSCTSISGKSSLMVKKLRSVLPYEISIFIDLRFHQTVWNEWDKRQRQEEIKVFTGYIDNEKNPQSWRQKVVNKSKKLWHANPASPPHPSLADTGRMREAGKLQRRGQASSVPTQHRNRGVEYAALPWGNQA